MATAIEMMATSVAATRMMATAVTATHVTMAPMTAMAAARICGHHNTAYAHYQSYDYTGDRLSKMRIKGLSQ